MVWNGAGTLWKDVTNHPAPPSGAGAARAGAGGEGSATEGRCRCYSHSPWPSPQEFPLAALAGTTCRCGFPSTLFPLHEREDEQLCAHKCAAEEFESCGSAEFLLVYQTQVQGELFPTFSRLPFPGNAGRELPAAR